MEQNGGLVCTIVEPNEVAGGGDETTIGVLVTPQNRVINGTLVLCEKLDPMTHDCFGKDKSDIITWDGSSGQLIMTICSDNKEGFVTGCGSTKGPLIYRQEVGMGSGTDGLVYTPQVGQDPGFEINSNITYVIVSDTPEPATLLLLSSGMLAILVRKLHR